ncbi:hypothetical protein QTP86_006020 [Hemibagrus guttatus]|nr:hypothetical protein QTP86_006020 [Hemibagrus guttatus]
MRRRRRRSMRHEEKEEKVNESLCETPAHGACCRRHGFKVLSTAACPVEEYPEEQAAGEQETGTVTENIQEREQGENKQDSGEDNTQTEDQEENKQQETTTESEEGRKDTEPEINHMESENEQSQGDMTKDTENSTQLANSQNTEECEGTDMTIDDSGFTPQLCREYTVNITRDITKLLKDLETGIVELQVLAESTGDRRHVEDLKVKKALMADPLGTKAQGALIRSRFKEANEMNAPSKYFFGLEKKNGQSRLIHTLHTGNGQYITHTDEIRRYATDFYQDLYRSEHRHSKELLDIFYQGLPKVSSEDNAALEGPLVLEELQVALNTMPGGKAPGIDGLPVEFWKELGEDVLEALKESCRERCLALSSRRAVITLLPKKGHLQDIKNWRPVSLLCTDYKFTSKALANRLRDIMDSVIQTDQTYCVPNRSIIDNVSLIRDILDVSRSLAVDLGLISLDQEKAFDRVEHQYLWKTLEAFGLSPSLIAMMKVLYQDVERVLKINGGLSAPFKVQS